MSDREISWADSGTTPNYVTGEGGSDPPDGNFVVAETDAGTKLLEWDDSATEWVVRGDVNASGQTMTVDTVDAAAVNTDDINSVDIYLKSGDDVQNRLNNLSSDGGGIAQIAETVTLSGVDVPGDVTVQGRGGEQTDVSVDADTHAFDVTAGRALVRDMRIDTTNVSGYTSPAVRFNDPGLPLPHRFARKCWDVYVNNTVSDSGIGLQMQTTNDDGISWTRNRIYVTGGAAAVDMSVTNTGFVTGNVVEAHGHRVDRVVDQSSASGEVKANCLNLFLPATSDTIELARIDGDKHVINSLIFDGANVSGGDTLTINSGLMNDLRPTNYTPPGYTVSDSGTLTKYYGIVGAGPLGGIDATAEAGEYDKQIALGDGTGAPSVYSFLLHDQSNTQWRYFDPNGSEQY